jgi:hypothetical protein
MKALENTSSDVMEKIRTHLIAANQVAVNVFFDALSKRLSRYVTRVIVIPLYGKVNEFVTIQDAVEFLGHHQIYEGSGEFRKYEVRVEFSNGDKVEASLEAKTDVRDFLDFVARQ